MGDDQALPIGGWSQFMQEVSPTRLFSLFLIAITKGSNGSFISMLIGDAG
jgi:hypothetical protein